MACGSSLAYDEALAGPCCTLQLLTDGVIQRQFNLDHTTISRSSTGNIKLVENDITVLLSVADLQAMGFADEAAFLSFLDGIRATCCDPVLPPLLPERLYAYNYEIPAGSTVNLADVMAAAATSTGLAFTGVASVDYDLKYVGGDFVNLTQSTTSEASENGPHGARNLDSGGSSLMAVQYESFNPIIYRKHSLSQSYSVAAGSVAILKLELIYI